MVAPLDAIGERIDRLKYIRALGKGRPEGMTRLPTRDATFDEEATLLAGHLLEDHLHSAAVEAAKPLLLPKWLPVPDSAALLLLAIVVWFWVSWSIAQLGMYHLAALTLVSLVTCFRIHSLTSSQDELKSFKDENSKFKRYNADLKNGVELLTAKNEQFKCSNQDLKDSIAGLEHIRTALEEHASKHKIDVGEILRDLRHSVLEQKDLVEKTRANELRTRKLTEMQVRAMLLNLYSMCEYPGKRGLSKVQFNKFCTMLPASVADKLSGELSFELVDMDGDGTIDIKNLSDWMHDTISRVFDGDDNQIPVVGVCSRGGGSNSSSNSNMSCAQIGSNNKAQGIYPRKPFKRHSAGCQGANRERARSSPTVSCRRPSGDRGIFPRDSPLTPPREPRNLPLAPVKRSVSRSPRRPPLPLPSIPSTGVLIDATVTPCRANAASQKYCKGTHASKQINASITKSALKHVGSDKAFSVQSGSPSRQNSLGSMSTALSTGISSPTSTPTVSDAEGSMHDVVRSFSIDSGLLVRI